MKLYRVIFYYKFNPIEGLEEFCQVHKGKCQQFQLKGRVYVSYEGINGTLAGTIENIEKYKDYLWSLSGFHDTEFKEDECEMLPFIKLIVKTRSEIVTLKTDETIDMQKEGCPKLSPMQWREMLESDEDYAMIDVRNNYESQIGHFEGAIRPDVENFYDFPQWLEECSIDKNKKVLMYCTGGIRCEKFSILMKKKGFKEVYQLDGGIINYAQKEKGAHFLGKCFVFDDRLAVSVNKEDNELVAYCEITKDPCDTYINCANMDCNKLFICSKQGAMQMQGCCSQHCMQSAKRRPFHIDEIYVPTRKWYYYFNKKEFDDLSRKERRELDLWTSH